MHTLRHVCSGVGGAGGSTCRCNALLLSQVILSATPLKRLSSGGPSPDFPLDPISKWPTEDQCNGNGLLAAAFRQDRVPYNVSRLATPAIRFIRQRKPDSSERKTLSLLAYNCEQPPQSKNKTEERKQDRIANSTYQLPADTIDVLRRINDIKPDRKDADRVTEGFKQLAGWPKPSQAASTEPDKCKRQLEELRTTNVTLPGLDGLNSRTECGNTTRSKIVVYIHNCFTQEGTEMLVRVSLNITDQREDVCQYNMLWTVQVMCLVAILMMALVAAACIMPEFVVAVYGKVCRRLEKRRRAKAKKER